MKTVKQSWNERNLWETFVKKKTTLNANVSLQLMCHFPHQHDNTEHLTSYLYSGPVYQNKRLKLYRLKVANQWVGYNYNLLSSVLLSKMFGGTPTRDAHTYSNYKRFGRILQRFHISHLGDFW